MFLSNLIALREGMTLPTMQSVLGCTGCGRRRPLIWVLMLVIKKGRENNPLVLHKTFVLFLSANILIGVLPVALTNSELPNSLRITQGWPFMCLLSGFLLFRSNFGLDLIF